MQIACYAAAFYAFACAGVCAGYYRRMTWATINLVASASLFWLARNIEA